MDELKKAVEKLNTSELYLDDNSPWRLMLTRGKRHLAVAEQHPEAALGDGEWTDGKAICDIVNEAIKLVAATKGGERGGEETESEKINRQYEDVGPQ